MYLHRVNRKCQPKGFTITELICLIIIIILFRFGFVKGAGLVSQWKDMLWGMLPLAAGIIAGSLSVLALVFFCIGIGSILEKRKKQS